MPMYVCDILTYQPSLYVMQTYLYVSLQTFSVMTYILLLLQFATQGANRVFYNVLVNCIHNSSAPQKHAKKYASVPVTWDLLFDH